jgi:hypothetical protein
MSADDASNKSAEHLHGELDKTLDSASQLGKEIAAKGREIASEGQNLSDWADATKDAAKSVNDPSLLGSLVQNWLMATDTARGLSSYLSIVPNQLLASTSSAASMGSLMILGFGAPTESASAKAVQRIKDMATRPEVYNSVVALLKELGLDHAHGNFLSALQHFKTAHTEYMVNAASHRQGTTWLIPIRECILTVLDALIRQIVPQERVKGIDNKVLHILEHFSVSGSQEEHIRNLSAECKRILEEGLSSSKQKMLSRSESESILLEATMWLRSFLTLIDPGKLRKPAR